MLEMPTVFVAGYPGDVGGAPSECWHTVKLWRRFGFKVKMIPTWRPIEKWYQRLAGLGVPTIRATPSRLEEISGLPGSIVVSFCNGTFLRYADRFRRLGCRIVWVNCMTWMCEKERAHCRQWGPFQAYVFQSRYQQERLQSRLAHLGVPSQQCWLIRGAFCPDEFPFRPLLHRPGEPLVIGRLSRASADKYDGRTWAIYGSVACRIRARVMGWDHQIQQKLGPPPPWAECLPAGAESAQEFLGKLHCLVQFNGGAEENWPRVGLEAMASGVPVVAENRWGWREMIRHGETGFLCNDENDVRRILEILAADENLRLRVAARARAALEDLADPRKIAAGWRQICGHLQTGNARGAI